MSELEGARFGAVCPAAVLVHNCSTQVVWFVDGRIVGHTQGGALYTDSARIKKDRTCLKKFYIHAPAKLKQDPATLPSPILDSHGCKKSKIGLGTVAHRGTCSETSGSLTPVIQI